MLATSGTPTAGAGLGSALPYPSFASLRIAGQVSDLSARQLPLLLLPR